MLLASGYWLLAASQQQEASSKKQAASSVIIKEVVNLRQTSLIYDRLKHYLPWASSI